MSGIALAIIGCIAFQLVGAVYEDQRQRKVRSRIKRLEKANRYANKNIERLERCVVILCKDMDLRKSKDAVKS